MEIKYKFIERAELPRNSEWHLEIAENIEVAAWWYGVPSRYWDEPDPVKRFNRAKLLIVDWTFELPTPLEGQEAPVELERNTFVVWQWVNNRGGGNGIYVANSIDQAVNLAISQIERCTRQSSRHKFRADHLVRMEVFKEFDDWLRSAGIPV